MQTRSQNLSNNIINICVHESVRVMDVFGFIARKIKKIIKDVFDELLNIIGKIITNKIVFANLNNHSSPPSEDGKGRFVGLTKEDCV